MKYATIISFLCLFILSSAFNDKKNISYEIDSKRKDSFPRIVYHDSGSLLPDSIEVIGNIEEISSGYCGYFCFGGTIKVRLENKIEQYSDSFAYLVTACLSYTVKEGAKVHVIASKLTGQETECYYHSIFNSSDSKGTPFYKLSEYETRKIK